MNSKIIISIVIIVIVIGGGLFFLNKKNMTSQSQTSNQMQNMHTSSSAAPSSSGSSSEATATNKVDIANFAFSPATIKVKVGDTVTWTNKDSVGHSATVDDGTWDTGVLPQGKSGSEKFTKAGTFTYHCSVHPNMHGTVIVQAQ